MAKRGSKKRRRKNFAVYAQSLALRFLACPLGKHRPNERNARYVDGEWDLSCRDCGTKLTTKVRPRKLDRSETETVEHNS